MLRLALASIARGAANGSACAASHLLPAACQGAAAVSGARLLPWIGAAAAQQPLSSLASILGKELKHERTVYEQDELLRGGPPAPFTLQSTPGDTAVSLTREYQGETVSVDASVNMQDNLALPLDGSEGDEDEAGELDAANDVTFNVTVTRGQQALVFECISDGSYLDVRHVSLEPAGGLDSETAYTGPVFAELDGELQTAFREFIAERGVNEDLGEYLRALLYDKEQTEYVGWLEAVQKFVGASS